MNDKVCAWSKREISDSTRQASLGTASQDNDDRPEEALVQATTHLTLENIYSSEAETREIHVKAGSSLIHN